MTQLSKLLIILAAVAIVSVIHAMNAPWQGILSDNAKHMQRMPDREDLQPNLSSGAVNALINTGDTISQVKVVNNIYQAETGSFYVESKRGTDEAQHYEISPLIDSHFKVSVTANIVRTRVTQTFKNQSDAWRSGVYVFPLPEDAAVDAMLMQIDERKIEGKIQQKAEAEAAFERAKREGKGASLVSQLRPNMFVNRIANIAPLSTIVVTIEYQQVLYTKDDYYQLRIPTAITPRYSPDHANSESALASRSAAPLSELSIDVSIDMGVPLTNIASEHHLITTETPTDAEQKYRVRLEPENAVSKEFVLHWQMANQVKPIATHITQTIDDYQYGLIQVIPPAADAVPVKRDLMFILDTSGSMVGDAIEQAKLALMKAIDELQAADTFNIIEFNSTAKNLWSNSHVASAENKALAKRFVHSLQASGGTEMTEALALAFRLNQDAIQPPITEDALQQILFITDGSVSNEAELLQQISSNLKQQRLFTIGIGSAPNTYFMSEAAMVGRGTYTLIGDVSQVNNKMSALLSKIKRPSLTDVQVMMNHNDIDSAFEMYPSKLPDIYAGEPITIVYRLLKHSAEPSVADFTLQAQWHSPDTKQSARQMLWQSKLPRKDRDYLSSISKHWANQKIQQLTRSMHTTAAAGENYLALQTYTEKSITDTALKHQLVSAHTSLIAIDEGQHRQTPAYLAMLEQNKHHLDALTGKQWRVTQMQLPQTSTYSSVYFLLGIGLCGFALLVNFVGRHS